MFPRGDPRRAPDATEGIHFENVKGLTRNSFRNYFEYIRLQLEHPEVKARRDEEWQDHLARLERHHTSGSRAGLNYRLVTQVVNAADYGVPQRRERVFFVGFREDLEIRWSFPLATHSQIHCCGIKSRATIGNATARGERSAWLLIERANAFVAWGKRRRRVHGEPT